MKWVLAVIEPLKDSVKDQISDSIQTATAEFLAETWAYIKTDLIVTSHLIILIGGPICVVLYVAGWEKGMKYLGIMFVAYILLRAILSA